MHRGFNKSSNGIPRNEAGYVKNSRFCFLNAFTSVFTQILLAVMMKLQCDLRRNVTPYDGFIIIVLQPSIVAYRPNKQYIFKYLTIELFLKI